MPLIIVLVVAVLIFCLLWYGISFIPLPANAPPFIKSVLYILLILVAVWWLYAHFMR